MKAITLWQPYASLIACGAKQYETRSWATKYRGTIAIHAAAKPVLPWFQREVDRETRLKIIQAVGNPVLLPRGCIIATAELVECWECIDEDEGKVLMRGKYTVENGCGGYKHNLVYKDRDEYLLGDFSVGRYAWELRNVKLLDEPIPAKGQQGLWNWNEVGL